MREEPGWLIAVGAAIALALGAAAAAFRLEVLTSYPEPVGVDVEVVWARAPIGSRHSASTSHVLPPMGAEYLAPPPERHTGRVRIGAVAAGASACCAASCR